MIPSTMRAARLHGIHDFRVETLPVPEPAPGELLVRIDACGICPTDARKYEIGVNDGAYPFNPGHEWVGRVVALGDDISGWDLGARVYGDIYRGYAEYATLRASHGALSYGALELDRGLPLERAIFIEPLADCLHAVYDQAQVQAGERLAIVGAGSMGLQLVVAGVDAGAKVLVVEPNADRRALAEAFGAEVVTEPDGWQDIAREWSDGERLDAVVLSIGVAPLVMQTLPVVAPGGRIVLFAGFGNAAEATVDLNEIHYRELRLIGSEWVGTPPNQRYTRYEHARAIITSGAVPLERLVTHHCDFDHAEQALCAVRSQQSLKTMLIPRQPA